MGRWGVFRRPLRGGVSRAEERDESWHTQEMAGERRDRAPSVHHWEPESRQLPHTPQHVGLNHPSWRSQRRHRSLWTTPERQEVAIWFDHSCFHNHTMSSWLLQSDLFFLSWYVVLSFLFSSRNFLFFFLFFGHEARRSLLPQLGAKVRTLQWKHAVFTTWPPGKFQSDPPILFTY